MSTHRSQTCISCKCSKPVSHFGLIGGRRRNKCIKCVSATSTSTQVYQRPESGTKYCIGCCEVYDISNFQSDPKDTTGLNTYCYNCKPHLLTGILKSNPNSKKTFFSMLFNAFCFKQCTSATDESESEQKDTNPNHNPIKKKSESYIILKLLYGFN